MCWPRRKKNVLERYNRRRGPGGKTSDGHFYFGSVLCRKTRSVGEREGQSMADGGGNKAKHKTGRAEKRVGKGAIDN